MRRLGIAVLFMAGLGAGAQGSTNVGRPKAERMPAPASMLVDTSPAVAPFGHMLFCKRHAEHCRKTQGDTRIVLNADLWATITAINAEINRRILPDETKGALEWSLDASIGNCNDYAVQKQRALIEAGFPRPALALSVVFTPTGLGHLVLTVRTDRGDFVLDNLRPMPLAWNRTGYRWVKQQSSTDPMLWVNVRPSEIGPVPRSGEQVASQGRRPSPSLEGYTLRLKPLLNSAPPRSPDPAPDMLRLGLL